MQKTFYDVLAEAEKPTRQLDAAIAVAARLIEPIAVIGYEPGQAFIRTGGIKTVVLLTANWERHERGWHPLYIRPYSLLVDAALTLLPDNWRMLHIVCRASDGRWQAFAESTDSPDPEKGGEPDRVGTDDRGAATMALAIVVCALRARDLEPAARRPKSAVRKKS